MKTKQIAVRVELRSAEDARHDDLRLLRVWMWDFPSRKFQVHLDADEVDHAPLRNATQFEHFDFKASSETAQLLAGWFKSVRIP